MTESEETTTLQETWDDELKFTVDAALLRELGERLVGRAHIALAEMIKNSYDADGLDVELTIKRDRIIVADNGHGMSTSEFRDYWMRVGSPHKEKTRVSRDLHRPLTGSKGVGRLAAQFLGKTIEIRTTSKDHTERELVVFLDWREAVTAKDLTTATASYRVQGAETVYPGQSLHGTRIVLKELNQHWTVADIEDLAREIWTLQPPFRPSRAHAADKREAFSVKFVGETEEASQAFVAQTRAFLELWATRIVGRLLKKPPTPGDAGEAALTLTYDDGGEIDWRYEVPECWINECDFEIRVFDLRGRQRHGVKVSDARDYLNKFGGVHVYDAGFHLPYYGPDNDWLSIEFDHAHRLTRSKLLPEELQVERGLNFLPTNSRLFGVVHVNTSEEREAARRAGVASEVDHLQIQVSRDRLVDNAAYMSLYTTVRYALDFYAVQEARRRAKLDVLTASLEPTTEKLARVEDVLEARRPEIPPKVYSEMKAGLRSAVRASETEAERSSAALSLLGPLATAGISAVAYEHEVGKQFSLLDSTVARLRDIVAGTNVDKRRFEAVIRDLEDWLRRARAMRALFAPVMDRESREDRQRYRARALIETLLKQMGPLLRGAEVDTAGIHSDIRLPPGTFAEWASVLQNVTMNAVNAMLDAPVRRIRFLGHAGDEWNSIRVEDTGVGVDLTTADELFQPFKRRLKISEDRQRLGMGGTGLGLTIVRMLADALGCRVRFVDPEPGFRTAFEVSWRTKH